MNRREFLKVSGIGAVTFFLTGCGLSALTGDESKAMWSRKRAAYQEARI